MTYNPPRRASGVPPTPAQELQSRFAAVKISFTWLGVRKTLSPDQKAQAAESFGAEGQFLSAGKKLLDTRDEHFQVVTALRHQISSYWKSLSLPYPEPGLRLIRHTDIEAFDRQMTRFQDSLAEAVSELNRNLESLKSDARLRLGSLYNPADYPATLRPPAPDEPATNNPRQRLPADRIIFQDRSQMIEGKPQIRSVLRWCFWANDGGGTLHLKAMGRRLHGVLVSGGRKR